MENFIKPVFATEQNVGRSSDRRIGQILFIRVGYTSEGKGYYKYYVDFADGSGICWYFEGELHSI